MDKKRPNNEGLVWILNALGIAGLAFVTMMPSNKYVTEEERPKIEQTIDHSQEYITTQPPTRLYN